MNDHVKRALVTGGTGFIGSHLIHRLVEKGWDVHLIIRPTSSTAVLEQVINRITISKHDGTTENLITIVRETSPDVVFHLSSLFLSSHGPPDVVPLIQSNTVFPTQLVEAMVRCEVRKLVAARTSWQHYHDENYCPVNLYAATKQAFESILEYYSYAHELEGALLTIFDTYGPNDQRQKLMRLFLEALKNNTALSMSPGEQLIDMVYVDDVVDAFMCAASLLLSDKITGVQCYDVSSRKPIKLKQLAEIFQRVAGKPLSIEWGGRPYRDREIMVPWTGGNRLPGWEPQVKLEKGIKKTLMAKKA